MTDKKSKIKEQIKKEFDETRVKMALIAGLRS